MTRDVPPWKLAGWYSILVVILLFLLISGGRIKPPPMAGNESPVRLFGVETELREPLSREVLLSQVGSNHQKRRRN